MAKPEISWGICIIVCVESKLALFQFQSVIWSEGGKTVSFFVGNFCNFWYQNGTPSNMQRNIFAKRGKTDGIFGHGEHFIVF